MPYPAECIDSYSRARASFEGKDVTTVPNAKRLGAESMTKQCFHNKDFPWWVCLVVTEPKKRLLYAEVDQLINLGKRIPTPYLGPGKTAEELLFPCKRKGQDGFGFMQMMFGAGFVETKVQNDESGNWLYDSVLGALQSPQELQTVQEFLGLLEAWVRQEDIPDLQVAFDPRTRGMYVFDPGDPDNWGSVQDKHLRVIRKWMSLAKSYKIKKKAENSAQQSPPLAMVSPVSSPQLQVVTGVTAPKQTGQVKVIPPSLPQTITRVPAIKPQFAQVKTVDQPQVSVAQSVSSSQISVPLASGPKEFKCGKCGLVVASNFLLMQHRFDTNHA